MRAAAAEFLEAEVASPGTLLQRLRGFVAVLDEFLRVFVEVDVLDGFANYIGTVDVNRQTDLVAISSPQGGQWAAFDTRTGKLAYQEKIAGVCGGLADYSRIDVTLWRIGFVVAALFGVGVLIYLLLWIIMPPPADATPDRLGPIDKVMSDLHRRLTGDRAG